MSGGQTAPRSAYADAAHINKLESEISDIKGMLNQFGSRSRSNIADLLEDYDDDENINGEN
jgi:uncharacterized membrane protein YqiK